MLQQGEHDQGNREENPEMPSHTVERVQTSVLLYLAMQSNALADALLTAEGARFISHLLLIRSPFAERCHA